MMSRARRALRPNPLRPRPPRNRREAPAVQSPTWTTTSRSSVPYSRSIGRLRLLQSALVAQAQSDAPDLGLASLQRPRAGVDRVVTENQIMRVLDGGTENESGFASRHE